MRDAGKKLSERSKKRIRLRKDFKSNAASSLTSLFGLWKVVERGEGSQHKLWSSDDDDDDVADTSQMANNKLRKRTFPSLGKKEGRKEGGAFTKWTA